MHSGEVWSNLRSGVILDDHDGHDGTSSISIVASPPSWTASMETNANWHGVSVGLVLWRNILRYMAVHAGSHSNRRIRGAY